MAWAERLPSGYYRGVYRDRSGARHTLADTYSQPAEAKRDAGIAEDKARRRPRWKKNAGQTTWGEWCDEWWSRRGVEPATARNDASVVRKHLYPRWGGEQLADISRDLVQDWVDGLSETPATRSAPAGKQGGQHFAETGAPLKPGTVIKAYRVFSASMKAALVDGRIDATPCVGIVLPTPDPPEEHFLTRDEYDRLLSAAGEDALLRMVLQLGVGTGLRWGELVGLHRSRVDLNQRRVIVQEVYDQTHGEVKPYPKGHRRRGVPLTAELTEALRMWMEQHPATPCRARHRGDKTCRGSLLIPNPDGGPLNYSNFRRDTWNTAVTSAGVDCTPHDLRHTYASWLLQDGVSIEALSALLGHKDIATTQRYAHLADTQWEQVREVLGDGRQDEPDEDSLRAAIARLAEEKPDEWAAVAAALDGTEESGTTVQGDSAPHLPHDQHSQEGGKIVHLADWRRSTG